MACRAAISREIYLRDTYERLGQEIREGQAPVELDGFLLHLKDVPKGEDAASWWNYAMAPFEFADLHWDNLAKRAVPGLGGHTPRAVRQICAEQYKIAHDRFGEFARMVRSGEFGLKAAPAVLIAARADSMRAVTAEQLYSLALLNEQKGWKLMRDANKKPLSVEWAASLLPSQSEVVKFSNTLTTFLSGEGWRKRIENNKAVLLAAIAKTGRSVATTSLAVLFVYGLASWTGPVNVATAGASSAMTDTVRIAGPGGTRPTTIAALGPGGTVATELVV
ncbi:hypothetical protein GOD70_27580 [Sinorhizobium medicae]|nr:hypothetical protein [Sinorhizobium medicae]